MVPAAAIDAAGAADAGVVVCSQYVLVLSFDRNLLPLMLFVVEDVEKLSLLSVLVLKSSLMLVVDDVVDILSLLSIVVLQSSWLTFLLWMLARGLSSSRLSSLS